MSNDAGILAALCLFVTHNQVVRARQGADRWAVGEANNSIMGGSMKINAKGRRRQLRSLPSGSLVLYASQREQMMMMKMLIMMLLIPRKNTSAFGRRVRDTRGTAKFAFYCFKISSKL